MSQKKPDIRESYQQAFERFEARLNGDAGTALHARRREAIARLADDVLPTARDEAWKHTSPAPMVRALFEPAPQAGSPSASRLAELTADDVDGPLLVFADGVFQADASRLEGLPAGVHVAPLSQDEEAAGSIVPLPDSESRTFAALNTAFLRDGAVIRVDAGCALDVPVQILHVACSDGGHDAAALTAPRVLVTAGAGSRVTVVETFASAEPAWAGLATSVAEIRVGQGAEVDHIRVISQGHEACHTGTVHVTEARDAVFRGHTFCLSGKLIREDVHTRLDGEAIDSTLNGLYLPRGTEQVDHFTTIEHVAPNCSSHELYKGILGGQAHAVFRGKIHVHQAAQKTDAYQSNQNLLMSDDAEVMSKPQLEIYADDVKCSHGSTTGELDEEALFYLRTRGVGLAEARRLLTRAFADQLVDRVRHEGLREHIAGLVARRLDLVLTQDQGAAS